MIVVLKVFFQEFDVGISKYSDLESGQQPISVNFSDWGLAPLATSEAQTNRHSEIKTKFVVSVLETIM